MNPVHSDPVPLGRCGAVWGGAGPGVNCTARPTREAHEEPDGYLAHSTRWANSQATWAVKPEEAAQWTT